MQTGVKLIVGRYQAQMLMDGKGFHYVLYPIPFVSHKHALMMCLCSVHVYFAVLVRFSKYIVYLNISRLFTRAQYSYAYTFDGNMHGLHTNTLL